MGEYLKKVLTQIYDFMAGLSGPKKAAVGATALVLLGGFVVLFLWAGRTTYRPLMTNLTSEDSAAVIRVLREKKIPFRVDPSGKNIEIPPESIYDLRLELATMGLPQSSIVGYEIFDSQALGTTSFVQKVNQKRALEGELMRTINTVKGVRRSRVHLALPQKSTFVEDEKQPTASVVLDLEPGVKLGEKQVFGIGTMIARAVEGLDINNVVIVDAEGKVLSDNHRDPLVTVTADQIDFQRKVEEDIESRVEAILAPVVGEGRVVARVNAELDFSQVAEKTTLYDGDATAVRSVQTRQAAQNGQRPGPYGVAGVASNTPGAPPPVNDQITSNTNQNDSTTNYEIPQTVRETHKPTGTVKKLSVAVVVDGQRTKEAQQDGSVLAKVTPWTPQKLEEFRSLVSGAVGVDKKRGDILEIENMEFRTEDFEEASKQIAENERRSYVKNLIVYSVIGLVIVLFFLFVVRPFIKWLTENTVDSVDTFLPQTIEELEKMSGTAALPGLEEAVPVLPEKIDPEKVEGEMIKEKIITLVDSNPHKAALIVRDWLKEEKKPDKKAGGAGKGA